MVINYNNSKKDAVILQKKLLSPNHITCQANILNQLPLFMVQLLPINTKARLNTIRSLGATFHVKISNGSLHC